MSTKRCICGFGFQGDVFTYMGSVTEHNSQDQNSETCLRSAVSKHVQDMETREISIFLLHNTMDTVSA